MDLRSATQERHRLAEETALSQQLITGTLSPESYAALLENMAEVYGELERDGMITKPEVLRYDRVMSDIRGLGLPSKGLSLSTVYYLRYLRELSPAQRWAHVYVHYLGSMYGGQMIARRLPGPHSHLVFDDLDGCKAYVRSNLGDVTADEANAAFDWTIRIYDDLHRLFG